MTPTGDPADLKLRDTAIDLCHLLRLEVAKFRNDRAGQFERLEQAYKMNYQPEALALAKALLQHVPAGDQTRVKFKISENDINIIERPLIEDMAATQLLKVARTLEHLIALVFTYDPGPYPNSIPEV